MIVRQAEDVAQGLGITRPVFLGAGGQAPLHRQQHDGLHEHPQVRPLWGAKFAVQAEEQADRGAKQLAILGQLSQASGFVFPWN